MQTTQDSMFKKTIRIGTTMTCGNRGMSVFVRIRYIDGNLSICGVEGPLSSGNALGSCGQITQPKINTYAPGWSRGLVNKLWSTWREWHLNDLKAGCEHQRALGWEKDGYDKHPSEACPICAYEYGTKWNRVEVPEAVLDFLKSLPDTDKTPAWV